MSDGMLSLLDNIRTAKAEIERLRAENKAAWDSAEYNAQRARDAEKRIEELHEDNDALIAQLSPKAGYFFTDEQLDAAWEYVQNILFATKGNADFKRFAKEIFERIGVVACEECGGSGVVREHERGYEDGVEDTCPSCHGHKWKKT